MDLSPNTLFSAIGALLLFKIAATIATVILYLILRRVRDSAIDRLVQSRRYLSPQRIAMMYSIVGTLSFIGLLGIIALIWSIRIQSLAVFAGAIVATIALGLFAQWSILSNITACVIMFIRFPLHVGDRIGLVGDDEFSATVTEFTPFYILLKDDNGNTVSIPNSLAIQSQMFIIYDNMTPEQIRRRDEAAKDPAQCAQCCPKPAD